MTDTPLTLEGWAELVDIGNRTWRRTLDQRTAALWYDRLNRLSYDIVSMALEDLSRTESSWPDLAKIVDATKPHRQAARYDAGDHAGIRLCDWLDEGAPGYPDGADDARRKLEAMVPHLLNGAQPAPRPHLELVHDADQHTDELDEEVA